MTVVDKIKNMFIGKAYAATSAKSNPIISGNVLGPAQPPPSLPVGQTYNVRDPESIMGQYIYDRARSEKLNPQLLAAIAEKESGGDPNSFRSTSPRDTSYGMFQMTKPTLEDMKYRMRSHADQNNPVNSMDAAIQLLKKRVIPTINSGKKPKIKFSGDKTTDAATIYSGYNGNWDLNDPRTKKFIEIYSSLNGIYK